MFVNVKNIRDAMRNGHVEQLRLALEFALPLAAACGGDNYVRLITMFLIHLRVCSDLVLALLPWVLFVDMGAVFISNDLLVEYVNALLRNGVPHYHDVLQWATQTANPSAPKIVALRQLKKFADYVFLQMFSCTI